MNDTPSSDSLLWETLPGLTLNIAQTAALCGISVRQLGYWTRQSYVTSQGRGARRTYGLDAVRRVLAIRKAMNDGASLRQALRLISALEPALAPLPPPSLPSTLVHEMPSPLTANEAKTLTQTLQTFFKANRQVRDHAAGLAVKLGRTEEDVRAVAEILCGTGALAKNICQGMTIFHGV